MKILLVLLLFLCLAPPAWADDHQPDHRLLDLSVASYLVLQGVDLGVSEYLLGSQRGQEANALLAPFARSPVAFSAVKMSLAVTTGYIFLRYHQDHPKLALACSLAANALYIGVVAHNARLLPPR